MFWYLKCFSFLKCFFFYLSITACQSKESKGNMIPFFYEVFLSKICLEKTNLFGGENKAVIQV